jgi:hypothetical protein
MTFDEQIESDDLSQYMTVEKAAKELDLAPSSIRRMILEGSLESRPATTHEQAVLLEQGRIKGVPGRGVRLVRRDSVAQATNRRKRKRK